MNAKARRAAPTKFFGIWSILVPFSKLATNPLSGGLQGKMIGAGPARGRRTVVQEDA
jgi:hypothetical protein